MPYVRKGNKVYNKATGKLKGKSKNAAGAKKYMAALCANEPKARAPKRKKR